MDYYKPRLGELWDFYEEEFTCFNNEQGFLRSDELDYNNHAFVSINYSECNEVFESYGFYPEGFCKSDSERKEYW